MCRNITTLFNYDPPATEPETQERPLPDVPQVGGYSTPSAVNEAAFAAAVANVSAAAAELVETLVTHAPPKDRAEEAEKARERAAKRFG